MKMSDDTNIIRMDDMMALLANRPTYYNNDPYDDTHIKLLEQAAKSFAAERLVPAMASASTSTSLHPIERLDKKEDGVTYIRTFLLNTKRNKRGWAVSPDTIHQNVLSIIGKPLVIDIDPITGKMDHPHWNTRLSAEANRKSQDAKKVGTVERVFYDTKNDDYYCDIRITDKKMQEYVNSFHGRTIPLPVSVQLTYNPKTEEKDYYTNYNLEHVALVEKGAYGPVARTLGVCQGDYEGKCREHLQQIPVPVSASASISVPVPMANNNNNNNNTAAAASASSAEEAAAAASDPRFIRNMPGWDIFYKPPTSIPVQGKKPRKVA